MASSFQKVDFEDCKDNVLRKLIEVFQDDKDTLANVIFLLNPEHKIYTDEDHVRVWNTLIANLHSDQLIRNYAINLVHCTTAEGGVTYAEEKDRSFGQNADCLDFDDWKANIRSKLIHIFRDDPEALDRILSFLEKEDLSATSHVWESLKSNIFNDSHFESYARSLLQDEAAGTSFFEDPESFDMDSWKGQIRTKLIQIFQDDSDTLTRILFYLDEEDSLYGETAIPPAWRTLRDHFYMDELFIGSANSFAEKTEEAEKNKKYLENMSQFYEMMDFWNESHACVQGSDLTEEAAFDDWKDEIRAKLLEVFQDDWESLARILFYLDEEDKTYENSEELPPAWITLYSRFSDEHFKTYAISLTESTKMAEQDEKFLRIMKSQYAILSNVSDEPVPHGHGQGFDVSLLYKVRPTKAIGGFAKMVWSLIPAKSHAIILGKIAPKLSSAVQSGSSAVVSRATMGIFPVLGIAFTAFSSLRRWRKGEITWKRLLKNILDSALTNTAGLAGTLAGLAIGGPAGVVFAFVGGIAFTQAMSFLSDRFTQWLFNIPQSEVLENAYIFLGIPMMASNHELNIAYRTLCLKYHPDKPGGSAEDFHKLQLYMAIIKTERGVMTTVTPTPGEILPIIYDN